MIEPLSKSTVKDLHIRLALIVLLLVLSGCGNGVNSGLPHSPLPEQYIWFSSSDSSAVRFFRKSFALNTAPSVATLYMVGPYTSDIFLNGKAVSHVTVTPFLVLDRPVTVLNISESLHSGLNTLAVQASHGDVLALKIVPAPQGVAAEALVLSDGEWKGATVAPTGWEQPGFDDSSWGAAESFGNIESDFHRFQGNFDLQMYQWPGYQGMNAILDHLPLEVTSTILVSPNTQILDFGREITGRIKAVSSSRTPVHLTLNLGESEEEASPEFSFLGSRNLVVPPLATSYGPLTAFRYVQVSFLDGQETQGLVHIEADQVFRNLPYKGSFESSDQLLNQIWRTSAYTALLGMQATYWDAPKRDRNPFAGDLYVAGRSARVAFGDQRIIRATINELLQRSTRDINNIPTYNALWVLALADSYDFSGDVTYLDANRQNLTGILNVMTGELSSNLFVASNPGATIFADWSPGMIQFGTGNSDAVKITTMLYYRAFLEGSRLFQKLGDTALSDSYQQIASNVRTAAISAYFDSCTGTFGDRIQTNAMAIFSGVADPDTTSKIFNKVLSAPPTEPPVSPYFNYFVLEAMSRTDHRAEALNLMRQYWGGMLALGATTFWEVYDSSCSNPEYHACLTDFINTIEHQGTKRHYVSLAHAWSSGPASWLEEEILGIQGATPGFLNFRIRPELAGLKWARGTETTPSGTIRIDIQSEFQVTLDLPPGTQADVSLPCPKKTAAVIVNGTLVFGQLSEQDTRVIVHLSTSRSRHFVLKIA